MRLGLECLFVVVKVLLEVEFGLLKVVVLSLELMDKLLLL